MDINSLFSFPALITSAISVYIAKTFTEGFKLSHNIERGLTILTALGVYVGLMKLDSVTQALICVGLAIGIYATGDFKFSKNEDGTPTVDIVDEEEKQENK